MIYSFGCTVFAVENARVSQHWHSRISPGALSQKLGVSKDACPVNEIVSTDLSWIKGKTRSTVDHNDMGVEVGKGYLEYVSLVVAHRRQEGGLTLWCKCSTSFSSRQLAYLQESD